MSWDMANEQIYCPEISSNRGDYIQLTRPLKYLVIAGCLAAPSQDGLSFLAEGLDPDCTHRSTHARPTGNHDSKTNRL